MSAFAASRAETAFSGAAEPLSPPASGRGEDGLFDFAAARRAMIDGQLRPNGIVDPRLLGGMARLERELFVPSPLVGIAYLDSDIPLLAGRALMQPLLLARLIQAAQIAPSDRVLDLAPATGYSTALLAALSASVVGVEPDQTLCRAATDLSSRLVPGKTRLLLGAAEEGAPSFAPYDVILVNGMVEVVPQTLFAQLAEGGRLVAVVRRVAATGLAHAARACLYRKKGGAVGETVLFDAATFAAPGFFAPQSFVF